MKLLAVVDGRELVTLPAGFPLAFSPDSRLLVTLAEDQRTVLLWDLVLIRQQLAAINLDWP
jgi:WD40 repeat protein